MKVPETKRKILDLLPTAIFKAKTALEIEEIQDIENLSYILNLAFMLIAKDLGLTLSLFQIKERYDKQSGEIALKNAIFLGCFSDTERNYYIMDKEIKVCLSPYLFLNLYSFVFDSGFSYNEVQLSFYQNNDIEIKVVSMSQYLNLEQQEERQRIESIVDIDAKLNNRFTPPPKQQIQTLF